MKKNRFFAILLAIALLATIGTFIACQKDSDNNTSKLIATEKKSVDFKSVDFSKIGYENGVLIFKSVEDYGQTIDNLLAVCDQYSADYIATLEKELGVPIDEANEDIIAEHVIKDDFFPFNPLIDFIEQFGFSESAYPVLREQEKEWLAKYFETAENPFDIVRAGYVQSALHNNKGKVVIEGQVLGWDLAMSTGEKDDCQKSGEMYKDHPVFSYNGKNRKLKGMLNTTAINVHAKSGCYYQNKPGGAWILWLTKVEVAFSGGKWLNCGPLYPINVPHTNGSSSGGLTEKYHTFYQSPTYLTAGSGYGIYSITGIHKCVKANTVLGTGI